jgi:alanine racemase
MTRIRFFTNQENLLKIKDLMNLENLFVEGIFSHLSKADEKDKSYSKSQIDIFSRFVKDIEILTKKEIPLKHIANSAAILDIPQAHFNMVRAGIILYGLKPSEEVSFEDKNFIPAMTLKARFSRVEKISPERR